MKKWLVLFSIFILSGIGVSAPNVPTSAVLPELGKSFERTPQAIPTTSGKKIEVVELFWYGCIHCYQMEEPLKAWLKRLPADVSFKRVPAVPRPDWTPMARAFFALEDLGISNTLHSALFDAVHQTHRLNPSDEPAIINFITQASGLDKRKVNDTFYSFSMNNRLARARQVFLASGATGVPSFIINGQYLTSSTMAGGNEQGTCHAGLFDHTKP